MGKKDDRSPSTWVLIGGLVMAAAVLILAGEGWVRSTLDRERTMNRAFYGEATSVAAEGRARRWYEAHFVSSGFQAATFDAFTRAADATTGGEASPFDSAGRMLTGLFESRLRAFWTLVYQAYVRISHLLLWVPYTLILLVPVITDALVARAKRRHAYQFVSPLQHHVATIGVHLVGLGLLIFAVLPVPTPVVVLPIGLGVAVIFLHRVVANYAKHA